MSVAVVGFGPLERWLFDAEIDEVLVNAGAEVWIERRGHHGPELVGRLAEGVLDAVLERMLAPLGRRLDRSSPAVDARLPDGARLCAVMPPVAVDGPCLAVRRFRARTLPLDAFAPPPVAGLLRRVVLQRCNVLVAGATSSGKTTLLNALAAEADPVERIVTLEDVAELRLPAPHVLRLEARPAVPDGPPAVELGDLLRIALRLRPDRLVIGEIRGDEAGDLLQALNTGHDGSLATLHANSATDALARLESLVVRAHPGWPLVAVREQVRRSIDVVIHVARRPDGTRTVATVGEVLPPSTTDREPIRVLAAHGSVLGEPGRGRR